MVVLSRETPQDKGLLRIEGHASFSPSCSRAHPKFVGCVAFCHKTQTLGSLSGINTRPKTRVWRDGPPRDVEETRAAAGIAIEHVYGVTDDFLMGNGYVYGAAACVSAHTSQAGKE